MSADIGLSRKTSWSTPLLLLILNCMLRLSLALGPDWQYCILLSKTGIHIFGASKKVQGAQVSILALLESDPGVLRCFFQFYHCMLEPSILTFNSDYYVSLHCHVTFTKILELRLFE